MKTAWKKKTALVLCGLVLCSTAAYFLLRPTDEARLRRRFAELEMLLSCPSSAGPVTRAGKARQCRHFLLEESRWDAPPCCTGTKTRDEISQLLVRAYSSLREVRVRFCDFEKISIAHDRAENRCTLEVSGTGSAEEFHEVRALQCILQKRNGEWFFSEIHVEEVIQR